jgi:hypothetical protein
MSGAIGWATRSSSFSKAAVLFLDHTRFIVWRHSVRHTLVGYHVNDCDSHSRRQGEFTGWTHCLSLSNGSLIAIGAVREFALGRTLRVSRTRRHDGASAVYCW